MIKLCQESSPGLKMEGRVHFKLGCLLACNARIGIHPVLPLSPRSQWSKPEAIGRTSPDVFVSGPVSASAIDCRSFRRMRFFRETRHLDGAILLSVVVPCSQLCLSSYECIG
ncbi:hypothetical protein ACOMHN_059786 [Nucella lapillus]